MVTSGERCRGCSGHGCGRIMTTGGIARHARAARDGVSRRSRRRRPLRRDVRRHRRGAELSGRQLRRRLPAQRGIAVRPAARLQSRADRELRAPPGALAGGGGRPRRCSRSDVLPAQVVLLVAANALIILARALTSRASGPRSRPLERAGARRLARASTRSGCALAPARTPARRVRRRPRVGLDPVRARLQRARDGARLRQRARGARRHGRVRRSARCPTSSPPGFAADRLRRLLVRPRARMLAGALVVLLGVVGLARIPVSSEHARHGAPLAPLTSLADPRPEPRRIALPTTSERARRHPERGRPRRHEPGGRERDREDVVRERPADVLDEQPPRAPRDPPRRRRRAPRSAPAIRKSLASRESCGASAKETETPAAASVGASFNPSPTKSRPRPCPPAARGSTRACRRASSPTAPRRSRARAPSRSTARAASPERRTKRRIPSAAEVRDDLPRSGPKLLGEDEERGASPPVGEERRRDAVSPRAAERATSIAAGQRRACAPAREARAIRATSGRRRPSPETPAAGLVLDVRAAATAARGARPTRPRARRAIGWSESRLERRGDRSSAFPVETAGRSDGRRRAAARRASACRSCRRRRSRRGPAARSPPCAPGRTPIAGEPAGRERQRDRRREREGARTGHDQDGDRRRRARGAGSRTAHNAAVAAETSEDRGDEPAREPVRELRGRRAATRARARAAAGSRRASRNRPARVTRRSTGLLAGCGCRPTTASPGSPRPRPRLARQDRFVEARARLRAGSRRPARSRPGRTRTRSPAREIESGDLASRRRPSPTRRAIAGCDRRRTGRATAAAARLRARLERAREEHEEDEHRDRVEVDGARAPHRRPGAPDPRARRGRARSARPFRRGGWRRSRQAPAKKSWPG